MQTKISAMRLAWFWLPVITYAGAIFFFSSLSHPEELAPSLFKIVGDKFLHLIEYGILGILCYRAFRHAAGRWGEHYALGLAILAGTLYGVTDEVHQSFVPSRESSGLDVLADAVGATLASVGWHWRVK